jgi:hypothetical protein
MLDGMSIYRAITRRCINWFGLRLGHAVFIGQNRGSSKRKTAAELVPTSERIVTGPKQNVTFLSRGFLDEAIMDENQDERRT